MITLYHHPICPLSRQVRIYLKELQLEFKSIKEDYWQKNPEYLTLNRFGVVPAIVFEEKKVLSGIYSILEYFVDNLDNFFFMPEDIFQRAAVREYLSWFNEKFYREVTKIIIDEKIVRLFKRAGPPRSDLIKLAKNNLRLHLSFLENTIRDSGYIVGGQISCAEVSAASHLSVLDFFGEIDWDKLEVLKNWYSILKSRPGFKSLLQDQIPGFKPPAHYSDLDF